MVFAPHFRPSSCFPTINGVNTTRASSITDPEDSPLDLRAGSIAQQHLNWATTRYNLFEARKAQSMEEMPMELIMQSMGWRGFGGNWVPDEERIQRLNACPKIKRPDINVIRIDPRRFVTSINPSWIEHCEIERDLSPLHIAVIKNDISEIRRIFQHISKKSKKALVLTKDQNGLTPLHWAAIMGNHQLLKEMLDFVQREDRLESFFNEDERGWSFLHWAIEKEDENLM